MGANLVVRILEGNSRRYNFNRLATVFGSQSSKTTGRPFDRKLENTNIEFSKYKEIF